MIKEELLQSVAERGRQDRDAGRKAQREKERNTASVFDISVLLTLGLKDCHFIALKKLQRKVALYGDERESEEVRKERAKKVNYFGERARGLLLRGGSEERHLHAVAICAYASIGTLP